MRAELAGLSRRYSQTYDALADQYEKKAAKSEQNAKSHLAHLARWLDPLARVLDVGCGVGASLSVINASGYSGVGIDVSPRMVDYARRRNPSHQVLCGDVFTAGLGDRYDCLYVQSFVHLFPSGDADAIFARFHELLKPQGFLCISTTVSATESEGWRKKEDYEGIHWRYRKSWTREAFFSLLRGHGFAVVDSWDNVDEVNKRWMTLVAKRTALDSRNHDL
ncbi:class I SAM-dependent methyltransferase [Streptosporangium sp. NPDC023963]|uniref:class I SAM-dependent DNA methyltransferase n=1 Tax=Streptosporangium sp. NPDC023963 TaxID=3155608 RepID=UPI0034260572